MDSNYTKVKNDFIRQGGLTVAEKCTYICLKSYAYDFTCFPSIKKLAADLGLSSKTVRRALSRLAELKLISINERMNAAGGKGTNLYKINEGLEDLERESAFDDCCL